jgi:hypothetical protein
MGKLLLLLLFLINIITNNAIAHQGTDELTFENWIKITSPINDLGETSVTAVCNKKTNYNEVLLEDYLDLNEHFNSRLPKYSITFWGWINSFGIETSNHSLFWHSKPTLTRWNTGASEGSTITKEFFLAIGKEGKFTYYYQPNRRFYSASSCKDCFSKKRTINIDNPDVILDCFNS